MLKVSILISFFSFLYESSLGQSDCILRKDKDSVKVYVCKAKHTKFKLIKAEFTVNASVNQMIAMWLDAENYNNWQYNTTNARLVKQLSENEIIYYTEVVAPWPMSNRDLVVHLKISQDEKTKALTVIGKSVADYIPRKDELVRIPLSISSWRVTPISESKQTVEYSMELDPGGTVPAWMVNMVAAEAPYITFKNFREKIKLKK